MDFVWVAFFILALVYRGQSWVEAAEQTSDSCYEMCPPGYFWYTAGNCSDSVKKYFCKKCGSGRFTEIKNRITECLKCAVCGRNKIVVNPCSFINNTECGCKPGYYTGDNMCRVCSSVKDFSNPDYIKKCSTSTTFQALPSKSTTVSMVSVATETSASAPIPGITTPDPSPDSEKHSVWPFFLVILATLLVLFWFLVFCGSVHRNQGSYSCWRLNKNVGTPAQDEAFKEQRSHHGSSPTPQTFCISEETPMMSLCQDPPAHICGQMPDTDHTAARQEERSDSWPAIVLYAIIKEVPLRRWKEFLRLLAVPDQQMERVELEAGLGSIEKQYQMMRLWSQRSSASLNGVYSALHHMELSGCAQLLQESLEKLQWRQGSTS